MAIPNNKTNNTGHSNRQLCLQLEKNFAADQSASGFSKKIATFSRASYLNAENNICKCNLSIWQQWREGSVTIVTGKPKIIFYEDAAGIGPVYASALNQGYRLTNNEATVVAVPYFSVSNPAAKDLFLQMEHKQQQHRHAFTGKYTCHKSAGETGQTKLLALGVRK